MHEEVSIRRKCNGCGICLGWGVLMHTCSHLAYTRGTSNAFTCGLNGFCRVGWAPVVMATVELFLRNINAFVVSYLFHYLFVHSLTLQYSCECSFKRTVSRIICKTSLYQLHWPIRRCSGGVSADKKLIKNTAAISHITTN